MINPALHDSPRELKLIGSMVIGYSELELSFARVADLVLGLEWEVLHALEKVYSETGKIKIIHALCKRAFENAKLGEEYHIAREMISYCAIIRNQYAHCHYARNYARRRLEFVHADDIFRDPEKVTVAVLVPIGLKLLREQETYFEGTRKWLRYLEHALEAHSEHRSVEFDKPPRMQQPPRNSSALKSQRVKKRATS